MTAAIALHPREPTTRTWYDMQTMETLSSITGNGAIALENASKGIVSIPCHPGTKVPCIKWKEWQDRMPPEGLIREWFSDARRNIAIITTGMVLFDVDDITKVALVLEHCGDTPHKLRTPRGGVHLGYRKRKGSTVLNQVRIKGQPIDIRTDGGLEMIPNSVTPDGSYTWLGKGLFAISELPLAKIGWTRQRTRRRFHAVTLDGEPGMMVRRARAYVAKIPGAVSGQNGHRATFRVACILILKFGMSAQEAWPLLLEFNERCEPPWTEKELRHKLEDALKKR
jgi:hypothetical protein